MLSLKKKVFECLLIFLFAALLCIAVFYTLRAPSCHILVILQCIMIVAFTGSLWGLSGKLSIHFNTLHGTSSIVFAATSTFLLMYTVLNWHSIVATGISLFLSSLLPGYLIVQLTRFDHPKSYVETLVLSYVLSVPITAVIGTIVFLYVSEVFRALALATAYFLMSLLLLLLTARSHSFKIHRSETTFRIANASVLIAIGVVFLVFISSFYPLMAYVPGLDIARLFGAVQQIIRAPETLTSAYPWFNFYEAVFFVLGKPSLEVFQTGLALSGFHMILAFYTMASIYLRKIDQRLPLVATVFWSIFGGFGWLCFLRQILWENRPFFDSLRSANDLSYIDIAIPRVWFWFRPMLVGFTLLFTLLYLLKRHDISTVNFRLIYSILIVSLALLHILELVIVIVVLSVLSFFATRIDLRLKDAVVSSAIGLSAAALISFCLYYHTRLIASIPYHVLLGLMLPLSLSYILLKSNWQGIKINRKSARFIVYAIVAIYIAGIMSWLVNFPFSISMVHETLFVPWLLYPVRLGLVGLLSLVGLFAMRRYCKEGVILFGYMLFSTLVFARLLSYVNIYLFETITEQRFIQASLLPAASILAALTMKSAMTKKPPLQHLNIRRAVMITLVSSLIIVIGTTSTFLAYEYHTEVAERTAIGEEELSSVYFLSNALDDNPRSPVLALAVRSMIEVEFAGPILVVNPLNLPAWSSIHAEIPLIVFFRGDPQFTAPYVYLHERDKNEIAKRFPAGLLLEEIKPMLPLIYQNEKVELYKIPEGAPPLTNASSVLLLPSDYPGNKTILQVFLSLSFGGYEYTTMLDSDMSALRKGIIIIPTDATPVVVDRLLKRSENISNKKLIVFNSRGYGSVGEDLFSWENTSKKVMVNLVEGVGKLSLPFDVNVPYIEAKENVEILGWFSGEEEKVPFVGRKVVNGIEVIYINIYPLLSEITARSVDDVATLLGVLLDTVELGLRKFSTADFKLENLLLFKDANFEGEITIGASSIVFPSKQEIQLRLEGENEIYNVCSILLTGVNDTLITTDCGQIGQGVGFYTELMLGDSTLELNGEEVRMEARLENNTVIRLNGSSTMKFHIQDGTSIYARTPTLSIVGNTTFQEAYGFQKIYKELRASGQTLRANGNFTFAILASDAYTIAKDLSWSGPVQRDPPLLQWNELKSLRESIPWFALAIIIVFMSDKIMAFWEKKNRRAT